MRAFVCFIVVSLLAAPVTRAADCADVAVVLAIDASSSIDDAEYQLQIAGYRDALSSDAVGASFRDAGTVAIAAVLWADSAYKPQIVPWRQVTGSQDLLAFATDLSKTERQVEGNTDMGSGLKVALDLLTQDGFCANRLVVDISGDGRASIVARRTGLTSLWAERKRAENLGVVVNGLAILDEDATLADYYRENVAVGVRSFVMSVRGFDTFRDAITQKLMREVLSGLPQTNQHLLVL